MAIVWCDGENTSTTEGLPNKATRLGRQRREPEAMKRVKLLSEGVAGGNRATIQPFAEPGHALLGASVGKGFRLDAAAGHLLDMIVANGGSCAEGRFHVAGFQEATLLRGVSPDSGEAVGLQFHRNGEFVSRSRIGLLKMAHLTFHADNFLDVVADFVGQDVGLREFAGSAKAAF